jgi:thiol-disulfide isomerase/thioredoxin
MLRRLNRTAGVNCHLKHRNKTPKRFAKNCAQALLVGFVCIMAPLASVSAQGGLPLKAPEASFTIDGNDYRISEFKERRLMLWFLSTWCSTCIQALKALEQKKSELEASGMKIVVLKNYQNGGYPGPEIHDFFNRFGASLSDTSNWMIGNASAEMGTTYNPRRYPDVYFLIDETGMVVAVEGAPAVTLDTIMNFADGGATES